MKKSIKNLIRFVCFLLVICILTYSSSLCFAVADRKDIMHIRGFFLEPENSLDVVLLGASELYTGFCSPMAWDQYGFTSYSFCYAGMSAMHFKPAVQEILTKQNPKLLMIEINAFTYGDNYQNDLTKSHTFIDNLPRDQLRNEIIKEVVPEESRNEFYFGFIKYHENWKHLRSSYVCLKNKIVMKLKGPLYSKAFGNNHKTMKNNKPKEYYPKMGKMAQNSLTELLQYLKQTDIENILFVRFPHCFNNHNPEEYDKIQKIIESYGYKFKNFEDDKEKMNLKAQQHFYNPDHLNIFGMQVFTKHLAEYVSSNYNVKREHSQQEIDSWNFYWEKTQKLIKKCETETPGKDMVVFYELDGYYV